MPNLSPAILRLSRSFDRTPDKVPDIKISDLAELNLPNKDAISEPALGAGMAEDIVYG